MSNTTPALLWFAMLTIVVSACGPVKPLGVDNVVRRADKVIGPEGGEIAVRNARLVIPAGVLDDPTTITLEELDAVASTAEGMPGHVRGTSSVFAVGPPELQLAFEEDEGGVIFSRLLISTEGLDTSDPELVLVAEEICAIWGVYGINERQIFFDTTSARAQIDLFTSGRFAFREVDEDVECVRERDCAPEPCLDCAPSECEGLLEEIGVCSPNDLELVDIICNEYAESARDQGEGEGWNEPDFEACMECYFQGCESTPFVSCNRATGQCYEERFDDEPPFEDEPFEDEQGAANADISFDQSMCSEDGLCCIDSFF